MEGGDEDRDPRTGIGTRSETEGRPRMLVVQEDRGEAMGHGIFGDGELVGGGRIVGTSTVFATVTATATETYTHTYTQTITSTIYHASISSPTRLDSTFHQTASNRLLKKMETRRPPPEYRRGRRRSTDMALEGEGEAVVISSESGSGSISTVKEEEKEAHSRRRRADVTSIQVPIPSPYRPFVHDSPVDGQDTSSSVSGSGGTVSSSTGFRTGTVSPKLSLATSTTTTTSSPSNLTSSTPTTTTVSSSSALCTENCFLPVPVDERVLPLRYTQNAGGDWERDRTTWTIFGRVGEEVDQDEEDSSAGTSSDAIVNGTDTNVTSTDVVSSLTNSTTTSSSGDAYEILATLPKAWGGTSERSAVYRVPLIIVASLVLAMIMVAFIVIVIVNRSKARRKHAKRKRRAARLAAATAAANGETLPAPAPSGNKLARLLGFRRDRARRASATRNTVGGEDDDDSSEGTSSVVVSEKTRGGLRRRRGKGKGLRWMIKRERMVPDVGGGVGEATRETLVVEGGQGGRTKGRLSGSRALFGDKVARWKAGSGHTPDVSEDNVAAVVLPPEISGTSDEPLSAEPDGTPSAVAVQSDLETASVHSVAHSTHAIGDGPGPGTTPETAFITAPVHPSFFLPAYRAASVHTPDRHDNVHPPGGTGHGTMTSPPGIGSPTAGQGGSTHLAGSSSMDMAGMSDRAFEKSPARYYTAPTTTEQEDALGVAFGVGGAAAAHGTHADIPEVPSPIASLPVTGHLATDDKRILESLRNAGSGPSRPGQSIPETAVSAPVLDVDEDGFERHPDQDWTLAEPDQPSEPDLGPPSGMAPGLPAPPRAVMQSSYAGLGIGSLPSAPSMYGPNAPVTPYEPGSGPGQVATPSAPALFEDDEQDMMDTGGREMGEKTMPSAPGLPEEEEVEEEHVTEERRGR